MLRGWINFAGQINWDFDNSGCLTLNYRNRHRQQTNVQHIFQHRHWRSDNSQSCKNIYIIQKRYKLNLLRCNIFKTMVGIDVNNCVTTLRSNLDIYCITQLACSNNSILWLWSRKSHLWLTLTPTSIVRPYRHWKLTDSSPKLNFSFETHTTRSLKGETLSSPYSCIFI